MTTTTRDKIAAQDRVLAAIIAAASVQGTAPEVAAEIRAIGSGLAAKWGVKHADLPDTRRSAGQ